MKHLLFFFITFCFLSCEVSHAVKETKDSLDKSNQAIENTLNDTMAGLAKVIEYDYDTTQWTDLHLLDSTIVIDMRYATTNNFVKEKMYECSRCFLRPKVAQKIVEAHLMLQEGGLGLKMLDCFRPRPIQQKLWDKFKNPLYVTDPAKGSMHNRGAAVDLTIIDVSNAGNVKRGNDVIIFGKPHPIEALAKANRTIPYEILSRIAPRIKRIYTRG